MDPTKLQKEIEKKYHFKSNVDYKYKTPPGINENIVREISKSKSEPHWMLEKRLIALKRFFELSLPRWAPKIDINYDDLTVFVKVVDDVKKSWNDLPEEIKKTFDQLGIPESERQFLAGNGAMFESEVVYKRLKEEIAKQGVIFEPMDVALKKYETLVREYYGKLIFADNKFSALNSALWSSGTFIYVPKGVKLKLPLQTYYRMNFESTGQFERTLIIVEEDAEVHYIEGCTSPLYSKANLHAGVVEVFVKKNARMRFSTVQNWSKNVLNLTTKRAVVDESGSVEWVDGNLGSGVTMKYPMIILKGNNSKGEILSIAMAGNDQIIDSGGKILVLGNNCKAKINSKGISFNGGIHVYRGEVIVKGRDAKVDVNCDALILDEVSSSYSYPRIVNSENNIVKHEAKVGKIDEDMLFYLMSRGLKEEDAKTLLILNFINPVTKELPVEYAIELNKLIKLEMQNANA